MKDALTASRLLRATLFSHIRQAGSIEDAAKSIGVGRSTLYHFLSGRADTGLLRAFEMAQAVGLPPDRWIEKSGLSLSRGGCAAALREDLRLKEPDDNLLKECARSALKLEAALPTIALEIPQSALDLEGLYYSEPLAAESLARKSLRNSLRLVRSMSRDDTLIPTVLAEFYLLVALYGTYRFLKTNPNDCAWSIVFALERFESEPDSHGLTWLLCDAAMVSRRLFQIESASKLAELAVGAATSQDTVRLLPRAWLTQASILFYRGRYREAAAVYRLVSLIGHDSIYGPMAVYSEAAALEKFAPKDAARCLEDSQVILDSLPPHRQMQRWWTQARVLKQLSRTESAFESFRRAIETEDACDHRDYFLVFDEARRMIGSSDKRLIPLARLLEAHLPKLSFRYPDEFLAAKSYLHYLADLDEQKLTDLIEAISNKPGRGRAEHRIASG